MIQEAWDWFVQFPYVPSIVYIVITLLVYLMWLLGTDWYDNFKKIWNNAIQFKKVFFFFLVLSNGIGFLLFDYLSEFVIAVNLICIYNLTIYFITYIHHILHSLNKWCLTKRGKNV